jgi:hypothetical protein
MPNLSISAEEAGLLVELLRPRACLLAELLEAQVQGCPEGDDSWADTADALAVASTALIKLSNALVGQEAA